jgi:hypothetical protein
MLSLFVIQSPETVRMSFKYVKCPVILRFIRRCVMHLHVARMGERKGAYRALVGNLREGYHLEDPGVDGRIILKWIFERLDGGQGLNRSGLG